LEKAVEILKKHWGFADFRPDQKPIIEALIQKLDSYLANHNAASIRERSRKYYDLKDGIEKYKEIYSQLLDK
jgi:glycosyltransferase involved in cell wall biosynthesis